LAPNNADNQETNTGGPAKPANTHHYESAQLPTLNENLVSFAKEYKKNNEQTAANDRKHFRVEIGVAIGV